MRAKNYKELLVREPTHKKLKLIAALCDERMIDTMERLATQELERLQAQESQQETKK